MATNIILQLADLITQSAKTLVKTCEDNNLPLPDLNDAFTAESEAFRLNPACANAVNIILAATTQLAATVSSPQLAVMNTVTGHFNAAALRVCAESNVTEILREAGPQGLHINEIAKKAGINSDKLGRLMRLLCNHHLYREVKPDVFSNTRISSTLDTGKAVEELHAEPENKHVGTTGFVALTENLLADALKSSAFIYENLTDPKTANSSEPTDAPFHRAFGLDVPIWEWFKRPENSYRRRRFAVAMQGVTKLQLSHTVTQSMDWASLPQGAKVVDVGGGVGTSSMRLARAFPNLNLVVQDSLEMTEQGKKICEDAFPEALETKRIEFLPHDYFNPQPCGDASVFILSQVVHNWSDQYAAKILAELRKVALPDTKLVIFDAIIAHACHDPNNDELEAPAPLLPNFGIAGEIRYTVDMAMLIWLNSLERTIGHLNKLLANNGWRIVNRGGLSSLYLETVVAVPIPGFEF